MSSIANNIHLIKERIHNACKKANRNSESVRLLLATKTVSAVHIKEALSLGESLIGENKVQELKEKYEALKDTPHEKHFIGHLQSNKIKTLLDCGVTCIQSLDRIDLAEKLHQRLVSEQKSIDVFIQVNTSFEDSKFGVAPEKAIELVKQVAQLESLKIKGLMTIGLFSTAAENVRPCFKLLKQIQEEIRSQNLPNVSLNELSMGMSNDLEIAIEEGATIIRVGTAIFGQRIHPDSYYWNESQSSS